MSDYEHLRKLYYTDSDSHEKTYKGRFSAPTTKHFNFFIRQINRKEEFPAFLCYTEELLLLVEKIYNKYENLLSMIKSVPPIVLDQFTSKSIVEEIKSSNDIEGVQSTRRELAEVLQGLSSSPHFYSVVKKYDALRSHETLRFKTCEDIRNFYDDFVHDEVAERSPHYILDGKIFRKEYVDVASSTGKAIHRGVYPEEKIIDAMTYALEILNDENIPFLVRVSVFHYLFGYIHPFYDGNGRTSRFIVSYFLAEHFHFLPALRLSLTIKKQRKKYYDLFNETNEEINCGDLTPFVLGFIAIIANTFDDIEKLLNRKMEQLLRYSEKLKLLIPADKLTQQIYQALLQAGAFFGEGLSMNDLMYLTGKSRNTIKSRLESTPDSYVVNTDGRKNFYKLNALIFRKM